ncbi:MAG: AtpZ/AtpI family protein [Bacillota bacterium]
MFNKTREKSPFFHAAIDFGYTLLASLLLFGWLGWWLDKRYQTLPLFLIGGIFLGLAVGFNSLFKRLNMIEKAQKAAKDREKNEPPDQP